MFCRKHKISSNTLRGFGCIEKIRGQCGWFVFGKLCGVFIYFCVASPVSADSSGAGGVGVGGQVPLMCAITSAPSEVQGDNMELAQADFSDGVIQMGSLVDSSTAQLQQASITLRFNARCNGPHQLSLRSTNGALKPDMPSAILSENFLPEVNYTASATWANDTVSILADGSAASAQAARITAHAQSGTLELTVRVDASANDMNMPLASGGYRDVLVVTLAPRI